MTEREERLTQKDQTPNADLLQENSNSQPISSDLFQAVLEAHDANKAAFENRSKKSRYRSPAFEFARRLKAHPELENLSAEDAADPVEVVLREIVSEKDHDHLWEAALGTTNSKGAEVDPYFDFIKVWETCDAAGTGLLEEAVQQAEANPRSPEYFGSRYEGPRYGPFRRFLTVAEELQGLRGDQNIWLPGKALGSLLKVHHQQISDWRIMAVKYGFLIPKKKYQIRKKAAEYRFQIPGDNQTFGTVAPEHQISRYPDSQDSQEPQIPTSPRTISSDYLD